MPECERLICIFQSGQSQANISKFEQRVLHVLAQGGMIRFNRDHRGKVTQVDCYSRDGFRLGDCSHNVFEWLRERRLIRSRSGQPYQITREGLKAVRFQLDNRYRPMSRSGPRNLLWVASNLGARMSLASEADAR